jgi:anthranilate phosphoribosyltransferase
LKELLNPLIDGHPASANSVHSVFDKLMAGTLDPAIAGAFLTLQIRNGIDAAQLKAALDVMMKYATTVELDDLNAIDNCGTGGDGGGLFNVSTTAAFVIAGAGHTVAKHGNRAVSSTCGSADLLEAIGVKLNLTTDQVRQCINDVGIGFMFAPSFHPAMRHAVPIRKALGVRTIFNMLGPLANPARVKHQLIGVFREDLTELFGDVLARNGSRAYVVYGEDGSDEITLSTRTKITEVRDGVFQSTIFDPRRHGFSLVANDAMGGGNLEENKAIFERVLRDRVRGPASELVVLNAGFAMKAHDTYTSLEDAFAAARDSIHSGKAWQKVEDLIAWTRSNVR